MKTWEKIQQLDLEYQQARQRLVLGTAESVTVTVLDKQKEPAALLKKPKTNAIKQTTD